MKTMKKTKRMKPKNEKQTTMMKLMELLAIHYSTRSGWCSWLSRQSNTLKVSSSSLDEINRIIFLLLT